MKNVMKTIMRNTKLVMILAFLPALLSAAQAQAVDYKSTYKGTQYEQPRQYVEYKVASTASAPTMGFQSTSVYSPQFGNGEQSMLNSDGTVNNEAYGVGSSHHPGSIRRADNDDIIDNPGDPDYDPNDSGNVPLGDVVWPLMMLLCAYAVYKVRARSRSANGSQED